MEKRELNVIFGKNGNGYTTTKITLPLSWLIKMGITPNDKKVILTFTKNTVQIKKG